MFASFKATDICPRCQGKIKKEELKNNFGYCVYCADQYASRGKTVDNAKAKTQRERSLSGNTPVKYARLKQNQCIFCFDDFRDEDLITVLPNCKHWFHASCSTSWLETRKNCPICILPI